MLTATASASNKRTAMIAARKPKPQMTIPDDVT